MGVGSGRPERKSKNEESMRGEGGGAGVGGWSQSSNSSAAHYLLQVLCDTEQHFHRRGLLTGTET